MIEKKENKVGNHILEGYKTFCEVSKEKIDKYEGVIPEEIMSIWKEMGYGEFMDGYLKVIDPDDYKELLEEAYFDAAVSVPIMVTAFGDVITWKEDEFIGIVQHKIGDCDIIASGFDFFFEDLDDRRITDKYFDLDMYKEAVEKYGPLEFHQCYGFVPLLGLGGAEKVENLDKVRIREHIALITDLMGKIE